MADHQPTPTRLMNFVSEDQLEESRRTRGARVEDGTAQRDRPLYEILQENKDKKDAEFNERFKHRSNIRDYEGARLTILKHLKDGPPKALDEDELEFLDNIEKSKREQERQMAKYEEEQLRSFKAALASQSTVVYELKETPSSIPKTQDKESLVGRRNHGRGSLVGVVVKVKPQAKKARVEDANSEVVTVAASGGVATEAQVTNTSVPCSMLVSYSSDESSEDDD